MQEFEMVGIVILLKYLPLLKEIEYKYKIKKPFHLTKKKDRKKNKGSLNNQYNEDVSL